MLCVLLAAFAACISPQLLGPVRLKLGMMPCKDRDLFWEGIDGLKAQELIDVCRRRAIRFHGVRALDLRSKHSGPLLSAFSVRACSCGLAVIA